MVATFGVPEQVAVPLEKVPVIGALEYPEPGSRMVRGVPLAIVSAPVSGTVAVAPPVKVRAHVCPADPLIEPSLV